MNHSRPTGDHGDTLVEILVALTVLGIGITALLGGLVTNVLTTSVNRNQAQVSATLLAASEHVKSLAAVTCGAGTVTLTDAQVPHDETSFDVTYGPAEAFDASTSCDVLYRVPVRVVGDGFDVSVVVVKRP